MNTITSILSISTITTFKQESLGNITTRTELKLIDETTGEIFTLIDPKIEYIRQNYRIGDGPCPYSICMSILDYSKYEFLANSDLVERILGTFNFSYEDAYVPFLDDDPS